MRALTIVFLAAAAAGLAPSPSAQITVTAADVRALYGGVVTQTTVDITDTPTNAAALQALTMRTGGGQTWSFTGLATTPDGSITFTVVSPPQPGSSNPSLATANLIVRTDSIGTSGNPFYGYFRLTASEFVVLGGVLLDGGAPLIQTFTPGYRQPLPYTFGSTWTSESAITSDPPPPFPFETVIREESEVVGWGTLVTPAGSEPALMIRSLDISRTTITVPGVPPIVTTDSSRVYSFDTNGLLQATITLGLDGRVLSGLYSSGTRSTDAELPAGASGALQLTATPNPAGSGPVAVRFVLSEAGPATVRVFDALGRLVGTLADGLAGAGIQLATWDPVGVPAGVYIVRVDAAGTSATRRVSVVR